MLMQDILDSWPHLLQMLQKAWSRCTVMHDQLIKRWRPQVGVNQKRINPDLRQGERKADRQKTDPGA